MHVYVSGRALVLSRSMDTWEDDDFEVPVLQRAEDEDEFVYVAPREQVVETLGSRDDDLPAMVLNLSAMAHQLGDDAPDLAMVRECVLATLKSDFTRRVDDLFASGLCFHTLRSGAAALRLALEETKPGSMFTVLEYPAEVDGVQLTRLWHVVTRPTEWEVVDEFKYHIG